MNNKLVFVFATMIAALAVAGCGSSQQVRVGEEGENGVIRKDIDAGNDVAAKANAARASGESATDE